MTFTGAVLLIDNEHDALELVSMHLRLLQIPVIATTDGNEAVKIASSNEREIQLILLDIAMPDPDGYKTCARLRQIPGYEITPIIALTALKGPQVEEDAYESGFTDFLWKPFSTRDLQRIVDTYLSKASTNR